MLLHPWYACPLWNHTLRYARLSRHYTPLAMRIHGNTPSLCIFRPGYTHLINRSRKERKKKKLPVLRHPSIINVRDITPFHRGGQRRP